MDSPPEAHGGASLVPDRRRTTWQGDTVLLQIKPALCQVWRDTGTVQIGLDPRCGVVLSGLGPLDRLLVRQLVGGLDSDLLSRVVDDPPSTRRSRGGRPVRTGWQKQVLRNRQVIKALSQAGVLVRSRAPRSILAQFGSSRERLIPDADAWSVVYPALDEGWDLLACRARRCVRVIGAGRTGTGLISLLAAAGVGRLLVSDSSPVTPQDLAPTGATVQDLGLPRSHAAARAALRPFRAALPPRSPGTVRGAPHVPVGPWTGADSSAGSGSVTGTHEIEQVDLVITIEHEVVDTIRAATFGDIPHLPIITGGTGTVVGPLVLPQHSPCLQCLELHRRDRDPYWPRVLAHLLSRRHAGQRARVPEETTMSALASALASLQVLAFLDGRITPACLGATLEIDLPHGLVARRPWPAHPSCRCQRTGKTFGD